MSAKQGFHIVDHSPFPMLDFKLNETSLPPAELIAIAEQMRLKLLEYGYQLEVVKKSKATAA